eukprot:scaffold101_cov123-Cylindrotheca_fusiformis.AAC.8
MSKRAVEQDPFSFGLWPCIPLGEQPSGDHLSGGQTRHPLTVQERSIMSFWMRYDGIRQFLSIHIITASSAVSGEMSLHTRDENHLIESKLGGFGRALVAVAG